MKFTFGKGIRNEYITKVVQSSIISTAGTPLIPSCGSIMQRVASEACTTLLRHVSHDFSDSLRSCNRESFHVVASCFALVFRFFAKLSALYGRVLHPKSTYPNDPETFSNSRYEGLIKYLLQLNVFTSTFTVMHSITVSGI